MATSGLSRPDVIARQRSDRSLENCTAHNVAHQLCDAVHRRPIEELVTLARSPPQTNLEARPTTPLSVGPFFVREPLPQTEARSPPRRPPAARRASGSKGEVALEVSATAKLRTLYQRDPRWCGPQELRNQALLRDGVTGQRRINGGVHGQKKKAGLRPAKKEDGWGVWANRPSTIT
jgi:hypothetical protein